MYSATASSCADWACKNSSRSSVSQEIPDSMIERNFGRPVYEPRFKYTLAPKVVQGPPILSQES